MPARTTDKLFRVSEKQHRHCWGSDRAQQFMSALLIKTFTLRSSSDSKTSYLGKEKEVAHADVGASPNCSSPIASCIKAQSLQEGLMHPLSHWWGWRGQGCLSVCVTARYHTSVSLTDLQTQCCLVISSGTRDFCNSDHLHKKFIELGTLAAMTLSLPSGPWRISRFWSSLHKKVWEALLLPEGSI